MGRHYTSNKSSKGLKYLKSENDQQKKYIFLNKNIIKMHFVCGRFCFVEIKSLK